MAPTPALDLTSTPKLPPPTSHTGYGSLGRRSPSPTHSPTRRTYYATHTRTRSDEQLLRDLSPSRTYEVFTQPSSQPFPGDDAHRRLAERLQATSSSERALGARVALAARKLRDWCQEIEQWGWSGRFSEPSAGEKARLAADVEAAVRVAATPRAHGGKKELEFWGALPAGLVQAYDERLQDIRDELAELDVDELKEHVRQMHSRTSRPGSGYSSFSTMSGLERKLTYAPLNDYQVVLTHMLVLALPYLSLLTALLDTWSVRIMILREVPRWKEDMRQAKSAMESAWDTLDRDKDVRSGKGENAMVKEEFINAISTIRSLLHSQLQHLGRRLDWMLDVLEGRDDRLPDVWIDDFEDLERECTDWVSSSQRRILFLQHWEEKAKKRSELKEEKLRRRKSQKRASQPQTPTSVPGTPTEAMPTDRHPLSPKDELARRLSEQRSPQSPQSPVVSVPKSPLQTTTSSESEQQTAAQSPQHAELPKKTPDTPPNESTVQITYESPQTPELSTELTDETPSKSDLEPSAIEGSTSFNDSQIPEVTDVVESIEGDSFISSFSEAPDNEGSFVEDTSFSQEPSKLGLRIPSPDDELDDTIHEVDEEESDESPVKKASQDGLPPALRRASTASIESIPRSKVKSINIRSPSNSPLASPIRTAPLKPPFSPSSPLSPSKPKRMSMPLDRIPSLSPEAAVEDSFMSTLDDSFVFQPPATPDFQSTKAPRRGSVSSVESGTSDPRTPPANREESPSIRPNRTSQPVRPPLNAAMHKKRLSTAAPSNPAAGTSDDPPWPPRHFSAMASSDAAPLTPTIDVQSAPKGPEKRNAAVPASQIPKDELSRQISDILSTIPAKIRLQASTLDENPAAQMKARRRVSDQTRQLHSSASNLRANRSTTASPAIIIAPARSETPSFNSSMGPSASSTRSGTTSKRTAANDPDIKLYHLSNPLNTSKPIKLFVRRVGENGERVMVRVGGGWADLGEYLRQYAEHHGRRTVSEGRVEPLDPGRASPAPRATTPGMGVSSRRSSFVTSATRPGSALSARASTPPVMARTPRPGSSASVRGTTETTPGSGGSRTSWAGDEVGLAGPHVKKLDLDAERQEWVEGMLDQAKRLSGKNEEFANNSRVGGTRRVYLRGGEIRKEKE